MNLGRKQVSYDGTPSAACLVYNTCLNWVPLCAHLVVATAAARAKARAQAAPTLPFPRTTVNAAPDVGPMPARPAMVISRAPPPPPLSGASGPANSRANGKDATKAYDDFMKEMEELGAM